MKIIWIVDDDDEMAHAVSLMLKMLGYKTQHFLNARLAAKELLDDKCPDLIILDINMPEVTGIMMLEFIRRTSRWKDLPVIMLSSETSDPQKNEAALLGADTYITKPVSIEELETAIQTAFKNHGKMEDV